MLTWRNKLKGMQSVNVSLLRKELMKRGQLGAVKFLPMPPSKALGTAELPAGAVTRDVAEDGAELVAAPLGAAMEERPVVEDAIGVAGEENVGRTLAMEVLTACGVSCVFVVWKGSPPSPRGKRPTCGGGERSKMISSYRTNLPKLFLLPTASTLAHNIANTSMKSTQPLFHVSADIKSLFRLRRPGRGLNLGIRESGRCRGFSGTVDLLMPLSKGKVLLICSFVEPNPSVIFAIVVVLARASPACGSSVTCTGSLGE